MKTADGAIIATKDGIGIIVTLNQVTTTKDPSTTSTTTITLRMEDTFRDGKDVLFTAVADGDIIGTITGTGTIDITNQTITIPHRSNTLVHIVAALMAESQQELQEE